jgi:hypothetical protein
MDLDSCSIPHVQFLMLDSVHLHIEPLLIGWVQIIEFLTYPDSPSSDSGSLFLLFVYCIVGTWERLLDAHLKQLQLAVFSIYWKVDFWLI